MARSYVEYTASGGSEDLSVVFSTSTDEYPNGYISRSHVKVSLDGVDTTFTWVNDTTVRVTTTAGQTVRIYRDTPYTQLVGFTTGPVTKTELNKTIAQSMFKDEELRDLVENCLRLPDESGNGYTSNMELAPTALSYIRRNAANDAWENVASLPSIPVGSEVITHTSIANAKADTSLVVGMYVDNSGYYFAGDGGGAQYVVVAGGTGTDDGGEYHDTAGGLQLQLLNGGLRNVRWWGAKGDGSTDDSTAVQAAATGAGNKTLYFPQGEYVVSSTITVPGMCTISGDGSKTSRIKFGGSSDLFSASLGTDSISMHDLGFLSSGASVGAILNAAQTSRSDNGDVNKFTGLEAYCQAGCRWNYGLRFNEVAHIIVDNCKFFLHPTDKTLSTAGIYIEGELFPTNLIVSNTEILFTSYGIHVESKVEPSTFGFEGVKIVECDLVGCLRCVFIDHELNEPDLYIAGCHFNFDEEGIYCEGAVQVRIVDNLIYCQDATETSPLWIYLDKGTNSADALSMVHIEGNQLLDVDAAGGGKTVTGQGVLVKNAENVLIKGNTCRYVKDALVCDIVAGARVVDNVVDNNGTGSAIIATGTCSDVIAIGNRFTNTSVNYNNLGGVTNLMGPAVPLVEDQEAFVNGLKMSFGSKVVTTNASGEATVTFTTELSEVPQTIVICNGDSSIGSRIDVDVASIATTGFDVLTDPVVNTGNIRVNYLAVSR